MRGWIVLGGALSLGVSLAVPDRTARHEAPTWSEHIAPLIHKNCSVCHTADGHAPFALETYADVQRRSELVRQEILNRRMPPFTFSSDATQFAHAAPLTDEQIVTFQEWLRADMPRGGAEPTPPRLERGFRLGRPDLVLKPKVAPEIPVEGNPVWRAAVIDFGQDEELRVRGFDVLPASVKSVRGVLLAVASAGAKDGPTNGTLDDRASRLIGAWAPGYPAFSLPDGVSLVLKKGERLIAQVLYQTTGKKEDGNVSIGLYLSDGHGDRTANWVTREVKDFSIPAYREVEQSTTLSLHQDVELLAIVPEARFFTYVVEVSHDERALLRTIQWNPYWPGSFVFIEPVSLKAHSSLVSKTVYENQPHTAINEGRRPRLVHSGPALDQEVCRTHYLLVEPKAR